MRFSTQRGGSAAAIIYFIALFTPRWSISHSVRAQSPATQNASSRPTTGPVDDHLPLDSPIRRWFDQLTDPDSKIRAQAKIDLMGITSDELPKLQRLIAEHASEMSLRASALHDIVIQTYLSDQEYEKAEGGMVTSRGEEGPFFIGLSWPRTDAYEDRLGITLDMRLKGFPGYRYLHDGDMILGVFIDPALPLDIPPNKQTHIAQDLMQTFLNLPTVRDVVLLVLRDGEQIRIPIRMAPRPRNPQTRNNEDLQGFEARRAQEAENYWQQNFAPLLEMRFAGLIED